MAEVPDDAGEKSDPRWLVKFLRLEQQDRARERMALEREVLQQKLDAQATRDRLERAKAAAILSNGYARKKRPG